MTFQLPAVEDKSACKFRKKSTLLLCSTVHAAVDKENLVDGACAINNVPIAHAHVN